MAVDEAAEAPSSGGGLAGAARDNPVLADFGFVVFRLGDHFAVHVMPQPVSMPFQLVWPQAAAAPVAPEEPEAPPAPEAPKERKRRKKPKKKKKPPTRPVIDLGCETFIWTTLGAGATAGGVIGSFFGPGIGTGVGGCIGGVTGGIYGWVRCRRARALQPAT